MAKRHGALPAKRRGSTATPKYWQRTTALLAQRDSLMTEIAVARSSAIVPAPLISKARALLTRFWSDANWDAREELLRAAGWLMRVGRIYPVVPAQAPRAAAVQRIKAPTTDGDRREQGDRAHAGIALRPRVTSITLTDIAVPCATPRQALRAGTRRARADGTGGRARTPSRPA